MSSEVNLKVAENSKCLAKKYAKEKNFGRAFSHYLVALKLKPDWKPQLKEEFSTVLCKWGSILDDQKRFTDLFNCYEQAVEVFPENEIILNNLGAHLLRCGLLKEAAHYFRTSLSVKPYFIRAKHNLENVSNLAVERWHFRMLNDNHRNEAYREAIIKKIKQGYDRILDIGTGTGILSLFCFEGKAKKIYACDSSPTMIEIANKVFQKNQTTGINLLHKHSSDLQLLTDIPKRVSLMVTETLDAGLLGEGILTTVSEAWDNLLLPPSPSVHQKNDDRYGFVIPFAATMYITGIECNEISNTSYLKNLDLFGFNKICIGQNCANYDTKNLKHVKYKCLTSTEKVETINFNDPGMIKEVLSGIHDRKLTLICESKGRLDCFAVWFDLMVDEDITLNTSPMSSLNEAWDQAIFLLPNCISVKKSQRITVEVSFHDGKLNLKSCQNIKNMYETSEEIIRTLNNKKLVRTLQQIHQQHSSSVESLKILDNFAFPIFGLSFLIARGGKFSDQLTCFVASEKDKDLVNFVANKYGIENDVNVLMESSLDNFLLEKDKFDVISVNFVEMTGELKDGVISQLECLRSLLKPNGFFLPEDVTVIGQFVYSEYLKKTSKVINDEMTCGYSIKEFINIYQTQHYIDLDTNIVEMTIHSDPFELFRLYSPESLIQKSVSFYSSSATPNALIYWFKIRYMKGCDEILTKDETSLYHQAAFLLPDIKPSGEIVFNIIRDNGLFNIEIVTS